MNGKENIINKILADADARCQEILSQANASLRATLDRCDAQIAQEKEALSAHIDEQSKERLKNRLSSAELEARKYKLAAKQRLIAKCYNKAQDKLANALDKDKAAFLTSLIKRFAEKGEAVRVSVSDKIVTDKFLEGFNMGLTLDKKRHDGRGGIILIGKGYEKNLTLETVTGYLREQTESQVAAALFGD